MNKFDKNKLYIFNKEKYGRMTPVAEMLHNRIVEVEDKEIGIITKVNFTLTDFKPEKLDHSKFTIL